jgi:hypothetical protein
VPILRLSRNAELWMVQHYGTLAEGEELGKYGH